MFYQKKQIESNQNQYKDLQAKYEKETSEMITKHDADIKGFKQHLLDAEEALKTAQKKNDELETQAEELKKQAEQAKVCILCYFASNLKFISLYFSESLFCCFVLFSQLYHFIVGFLWYLFWTFPEQINVD